MEIINFLKKKIGTSTDFIFRDLIIGNIKEIFINIWEK